MQKIKRFGSTPFFNFLNSSIFNFVNLKNERFSPFNVSFLCYNTCYLYFPVSQNIEERERERESMKLALVLGAYDLNLSTRLSKLHTVLQRHLGFLKDMFREDIEFVFIFIFWEVFKFCKWLRYSDVCKIKLKIWNNIILFFFSSIVVIFLVSWHVNLVFNFKNYKL